MASRTSTTITIMRPAKPYLWFVCSALALCQVQSASAGSASGSNSGDVWIPDGPGTYVHSPIAISAAPAGAVVTRIDWSFQITHADGRDLDVDLNDHTRTSTYRADLWRGTFLSGGTDSGTNPSRSGTITSGPLIGLPVNQTWYLAAADVIAPDVGFINSWSITVHWSDGPPPTPSGMNAVGSGASIIMGWEHTPNETGYVVQRRTGFSGSWTDRVTLPANWNAWQDFGVDFGQVYCYRVRAFNAAGNSPHSDEDCAIALEPPDLTFPGNGAVITTNSVTLQWDGVTGAERYLIDMGGSCGSTSVLGNAEVFSESYTVTDLANGPYYWRVQAANLSSGGFSDESSCRYLTINAPAGGNLSVTPSGGLNSEGDAGGPFNPHYSAS